jgi:hypothetical protein
VATHSEAEEMGRPNVGRRNYDAIDGMPWWVKAIGFVGVPSAIAMYLIYALVANVVPAMFDMQRAMNNLAVSVGNISTEHAESKRQTEEMLKVLRGSCLNQAKTYEEKSRCL